MSLSPSAEWLDAVTRGDAAIRFLVEITDEDGLGGGTYSYKATSGSVDGLTYPEAVHSVEPMAVELDPLTRETKSAAIQIVFDDDWIRPIIVENQILHQKCVIKIGAQEVQEGNFLAYFTGPIEEIQPNQDGTVTLEIEDIYTVLAKTEITGSWGGHPLGVIEEILSTDVGLPDAFVDDTSLDPTGYSDIGHFQVVRGYGTQSTFSSTTVKEPTSAFDLINELTRLLNGQLLADETGALKFIKFDGSASAVDHWDSDVILPGTFSQEGAESKIINRVIGNYSYSPGSSAYVLSYQADETASQSAQAYPGSNERILAEEFDTPWLGYRGQIAGTTNWTDGGINNSVTDFLIGYPNAALSGTRDTLPGPQPANADCQGARPVWLMIGGLPTPGEPDIPGPMEIVKVTGIATSSAAGATSIGNLFAAEPESGEFTNLGQYYSGFRLTAAARGQLGTTAQAWAKNTIVTDITILVHLADEILGRFADGIHLINLETSIDRYSVQVGDLVTIENDDFLAYGLDGITSAKKWEVVGKEVLAMDGQPRIKWSLAYAPTNAITRVGVGHGGRILLQDVIIERNIELGANVDPAATEGMSVTQTGGSGLIGSTSTGTATGPNFSSGVAEAVSHTYSASKDTYVYMDTKNGSVEYLQTALGAGAPSVSAMMVPLAKVTTDATDITAIEDLRVTTAVDGGKLHEQTVSETEVADNAIAPIHVNREQTFGRTLNLNSTFSLRTRV